MKRIMLGFFVSTVLCLGFVSWSSPVIAEETNQPTTSIGNKFCPVSGDKVSGKSFVEYHGKRYGLCCPMCAGKFKKNPEKYIAQLNALEKSNS